MIEYVVKIMLIAILVFIINLPFGYWRSCVKKYSVKWFLFIHLPVPLIIGLRIFSNIGFAWYTYPILVSAFFMGQLVGRKFVTKLINQYKKTQE